MAMAGGNDSFDGQREGDLLSCSDLGLELEIETEETLVTAERGSTVSSSVGPTRMT